MRPHLLLLTALCGATLACATLTPKPAIEWETAGDQVVLEYNCFGGLVPIGYNDNAIAPVRLWGDGRLVWLEYSGSGRRVLEARLTPDEMRALLTRVADAGFFGWPDEYTSNSVIYDGVDCDLEVALKAQQKGIWVRAGAEPPAAFGDLVNWLVAGAGASGHDVVPERGWLSAIPTGNNVDAVPNYVWPADGLGGVRLADATQPVPVEGEALTTAWDIVNANRYAMVESDGMLYTLVVQVERVTDRWPGSQ